MVEKSNKLKICAYLIGVFSFLLMSCSEKEKSWQSKTTEKERLIQSFYGELNECRNKIIDYGDTSCYALEREFAIKDTTKESLFWAVIMANEYNYPLANFDVFNLMLTYYVDGKPDHFFEIDSISKAMMLDYLDIAIAFEVPEAIEMQKKIVYQKPNDLKQLLFKPSHFEDTFFNRVYYLGDTTAYMELFWYYAECAPERSLFWKLFMANRYGFPSAILDSSSGMILEKYSPKTKSFIMDYL